MKNTPKERLLSELPDGQADQVLWLVDNLTCLICGELDKYTVNQSIGIGILSIVMAKMAGYSAALAGTDEPGLNEAIARLSNNIKINSVEFYKIKKEEMDESTKNKGGLQ